MPIPSRASGRSSQSRSLSPVIEVSALSGRMPMHVLAYLRRILRLLIHGVALGTAVRVSWSIALPWPKTKMLVSVGQDGEQQSVLRR